MQGRAPASAGSLIAKLAAALISVTVSCGPSAAGNSPPDKLRDGFFKVVFGLEYGRHHGDSQRVKKYTETVRFHVINHARENRTATVQEFILSLPGKVPGLRSMLVRDREKANFTIFLVDREDFSRVVSRELRADAVAMGARCLVGVRTRSGRILSSTAVIVADDPYLFQRCMVEEILQGLGPMNDNATLSESVFNDSSRHTDFTSFDQALMRMLYHPSIRPGMTGSEVHQLLPQVFVDLGFYR